MRARQQLALLGAATLILVALVVAVLVLSHRGGGHGSASQSLEGALTDIPAASFTLRDQNGRRVSLRSYRGQVVILTFLYAGSSSDGPLLADQIRGALDELGHPATALAISVDPETDTPAAAERFLTQYDLSGRMRFLLGSRAQLAPIWKAYGIGPQTPGAHGDDFTAFVLLIDRRGIESDGFPLEQLTPEALAHDVGVLQRRS